MAKKVGKRTRQGGKIALSVLLWVPLRSTLGYVLLRFLRVLPTECKNSYDQGEI